MFAPPIPLEIQDPDDLLIETWVAREEHLARLAMLSADAIDRRRAAIGLARLGYYIEMMGS